MAPADQPDLSIGPGQVREYILSMLDGLSGLADAAGDAQTSERLRQFACSLIVDWSPRPIRPHPDGSRLEPSPAVTAEAPGEDRGGPARIV